MTLQDQITKLDSKEKRNFYKGASVWYESSKEDQPFEVTIVSFSKTGKTAVIEYKGERYNEVKKTVRTSSLYDPYNHFYKYHN